MLCPMVKNVILNTMPNIDFIENGTCEGRLGGKSIGERRASVKALKRALCLPRRRNRGDIPRVW